MLDCAIIGDSIAVGLAPYLPECVEGTTRVGLHAYQCCTTPSAALTIISIGSNDLPVDIDELRRIRQGASARVLWIIPANHAHNPVLQFANQLGDLVVFIMDTNDGVHPASYRQLADQVRALF